MRRKQRQGNYSKSITYNLVYILDYTKWNKKMIVMHVVLIDIETTEADSKEAWGIRSKKPSYLKHTRIKEEEEKQKLEFSLVARSPVATVENFTLWGFAIH